MMKKRIASLLCCGMVFSMLLAGCGSSGSDSAGGASSEAAATVATEAATTAATSASTVESTAETTTSDGDYSGVKVACIVKTQDNVYWSDMGTAIEDWAKQNNATVDMYYAESEENIQGQLEQFENLINMKYDAICFAPLTSQNLIGGIQKATDAGIVTVNIDESADFDAVREAGGVVYSNFVTDNVLVGTKAADYIADKLGGSGDVAIVEGAAGNTTSQSRTKGATDEFKAKGLNLVASEPGDWDRMKSMDVAAAMITSNPNLKAIYACNDVEALGVTEAVKNAGKIGEILVVGTDATADGKASIAKGEETASIGQANTEIGIDSVKSAIEAVKAGFVPKDHVGDDAYPQITYVDSFIVDADNVAEYQ